MPRALTPVLPPSLTTTQRDALSSPADGSIIYNATKGLHEFRRAGAWESPWGVDFDFSTDPGLGYLVLSQPTGIEQFDQSIVSNRLRITAPAANTNQNLRTLLPAAKAGVLGDSEIRSTWYGFSSTFAAGTSRFQFGHAHNITATRQEHWSSTATAGAVGSLTDSAAAWPSGLWAGANAFAQHEFYCTIINGTGSGQTRRIYASSANVLSIMPNWTTTPDTTSKYMIWTKNVRAVTVTLNIVLSGYYILNAHCWEGSVGNLLGGSGTTLQTYLYPSSVMRELPWMVKTRRVGRTLDAAVTVVGDAENNYGDSGKSFSWTLPLGFEEAGMMGLYSGHMNATETMDYDDASFRRA